jgi:hypothetical protein
MRSHKKIQKEEQPSRTSLIQIGPGSRYIRSATRSLYTSETSLVALRKPPKEASQRSLPRKPPKEASTTRRKPRRGQNPIECHWYNNHKIDELPAVSVASIQCGQTDGSTDADTPAERHNTSAWNGGCWPFDSDSGSTQPGEQPILERWTKTALCVTWFSCLDEPSNDIWACLIPFWHIRIAA